MSDFKQSEIVPKWTGTWQNMLGPNGTQLRFSRFSQRWVICNYAGKIISRHDARPYALRKAKKLDEQIVEPKP